MDKASLRMGLTNVLQALVLTSVLSVLMFLLKRPRILLALLVILLI